MFIILWVIFLKKIVQTVLFTVICTSLFLGASFGYLKYNLNMKTINTEQKQGGIPYKKTPSNCGVSFVFENDSACILYLDFKKTCINVIDIPEFDEKIYLYNGFTNDYQIYFTDELLCGIIDRIGGIDLTFEEETLRYTGSQVIEYLLKDNTNKVKRQIISQIFEKISKNDFSKDDFVYIIENSKTNLRLIDCIYWIGYLKDMSATVNFIEF